MIIDRGSIQNIDSIPQNIKNRYKIVWETKQRVVIDLAADRGKFVDQTQSMNISLARPNNAKLTSCHFYSWKKGLKTGMYYLRSRPAAEADKFSIKQTRQTISQTGGSKVVESFDSTENSHVEEQEDDCLMCGS